MSTPCPSRAHRWVPCPGSHALELQAPPDTSPPDPVQLEGKAGHWVAERCAGSWAGHVPFVKPSEFLGQTHPETGTLIDEDLIYAVEVYLAALRERFELHPDGLRIEEQISCRPTLANGGRADATWVSQDAAWLTVFDAKLGYAPVSAVGNWQLINYAIGKISPLTQTIEMVIVQPRGASAAEPVKTWQVEREEFVSVWVPQIQRSFDEATGPEACRTQAGPQCNHCLAAPACQTLRAASMRAIDSSREAIALEPTNEELAHEIHLLRTAETALDARKLALEGLAAARISSGNRIAGFEVSGKLSNRFWKGCEVELLGHLCGVDLMARKPVSPRQAEALGAPKALVDRFTTRAMGAPKLREVKPGEARNVFRK